MRSRVVASDAPCITDMVGRRVEAEQHVTLIVALGAAPHGLGHAAQLLDRKRQLDVRSSRMLRSNSCPSAVTRSLISLARLRCAGGRLTPASSKSSRSVFSSSALIGSRSFSRVAAAYSVAFWPRLEMKSCQRNSQASAASRIALSGCTLDSR